MFKLTLSSPALLHVATGYHVGQCMSAGWPGKKVGHILYLKFQRFRLVVVLLLKAFGIINLAPENNLLSQTLT